jgi:hypothetical protein
LSTHLSFGWETDKTLSVISESDNGWGGTHTLSILDDSWVGAFHDCYTGVGGSQINSNDRAIPRKSLDTGVYFNNIPEAPGLGHRLFCHKSIEHLYFLEFNLE